VPEIVAGLAGGKASSERADPAVERGTVRSATLRRQALSLLNGISWGSDPVSIGADSGVCRPRASIASRTPGTLCAGRLSMTTIVALERWRETG
jgi:hypothetical protein